MKKIEFINNYQDKILNIISKNYPISYNTASKLLRNKDIIVNNERIKENINLFLGDKVTFYINEKDMIVYTPQIEYEDENIIIAFKPRGIESEGKDSFQTLLQNYLNISLYAVHRLDRNTNGLIIFAKNTESEKSLINAFKLDKIEKYYLAEVTGKITTKEKTLTNYLVKDSLNSLVKIYNNEVKNSKKVIIKYKLIKSTPCSHLLEIELHGGKTHQIRAQLAFNKLPIIGDDKYGDTNLNKKFGKKRQMLTCYKIVLHIDANLSYLNNKEVVLSNCKNNLFVVN